MRRVQVESPFAPRTPMPEDTCKGCGGDYGACQSCIMRWLADGKRLGELSLHRVYLARCLRDCIKRGETPYASHGLLTLAGVLHDNNPAEREQGILAGFAMRRGMHATVVYIDCYDDNWRSGGMQRGVADVNALQVEELQAGNRRHELEVRRLADTDPTWKPIVYLP